jgi:hypothetical protein
VVLLDFLPDTYTLKINIKPTTYAIKKVSTIKLLIFTRYIRKWLIIHRLSLNQGFNHFRFLNIAYLRRL